MICFNCKAQLPDGTQFCPDCGCRQLAATDRGVTQAADFDATQAAPFAATQPIDFDATQAAPFGATQAAGYQTQGYSQPQNYGCVPPVAPPPVQTEPPKKNGKGIIIAVAGAVAVLAVVAGVLAFKLLPDIGASKDNDDKKEESTTAVSTHSKKHGYDDGITLPELTAPQLTAPGIIDVTGEEIIVPTVPHGNDTVNIGDIFRPTQAPATQPARPKPTAPPVTDRYYEDYTEAPDDNSDFINEPYATVDTYADCAHIGIYVYDENGNASYGEVGYFYKDGNLCLFMEVEGESVVIETDDYSGYMTAYMDEGYGYYELDTTQEKCEEVGDFIVYQLVELGFNKDEIYPEYQYDYLGDDQVEDIGNCEFYDLYDERGNYMGAVVVDEYSGYYAAVFDENDNFVYLTDFIDLSGSYLPYNFR
ncbi:MAG: zinc ribbon domain-containing protein [Clostridia bacterium]|nr:zinc ribbon domain-containing protein [Clostridia bacterium]